MQVSAKVIFASIQSGFKVIFYRPAIKETLIVEKSEGVNRLDKYIEENPGKRAPFIAAQLKVPQKTLERRLKQLKSDGKIRYAGSAKTGGYYTIGAGPQNG